MPEHQRQPVFQRNQALEELLAEINTLLAPAEKQLVEKVTVPQHPTIIVVGAPRSGTTLLMQWLASLGYFAYPTNLLSRFFGAPAVGAKIQLLLTDPRYNFNDEFFDFSTPVAFESNLGKTQGVLAPNEFWYFWRRFIPNEEPRPLSDEELKAIDGEGLVAELAAIESVFEKPFAMKGLIMEFNIPSLFHILPKALFINIRRHPLYNIQSLLEAREKYYGTRQGWYSVKPAEYEMLKGLHPIEQVTGQVYYTNRAIQQGLDQIHPSNVISIRYEDFCAAPSDLFNLIRSHFTLLGDSLNGEYQGPTQFEPRNHLRLSDNEIAMIMASYERFSGEKLSV